MMTSDELYEFEKDVGYIYILLRAYGRHLIERVALTALGRFG